MKTFYVKFTSLFLISLATLVLTGCQTAITKTAEVDTSWYVPEALLIPCVTPQPPNQDVYNGLPQWVDKEKMWLDTYSEAVKAIANCNADKKAIAQDQTQQKALRDKARKD